MTKTNGRPVFRLPVWSFFFRIGAVHSNNQKLLLLCAAAALILTSWTQTADMLLPAVCALMLVVGLPHGIFDYLTLRKIGHKMRGRIMGPLAGYCAAALLTWAMWQVGPLLSLSLFLIVAVVHFSEDWMKEQSRLGAIAMAISMIALPSILYPAELALLLSAVAGVEAGMLADSLRLVAPVFGLVAVAHVVIAVSDNAIEIAWRNLTLLLCAFFLPPGIGFAIYFCVHHSPMHFSEGKAQLTSYEGNVNQFYVGMSAACVLAVAFVFIFQPHQMLDKAIVASTFQTLSILTIPHMLLALVTARYVPSFGHSQQ
ncbi:Brp/Blh family beta-carotene 15,15'-dioxygenase [Sphingorhabdus arenilitoris]|uniref:Brp/Blh family beta-carotene 15,15'-dioxygenase n=1 Tax=Sphingorhabdus arenilitoris TaxID=1490041 RepID=A0ABV8RDK2_9SPHN